MGKTLDGLNRPTAGDAVRCDCATDVVVEKISSFPIAGTIVDRVVWGKGIVGNCGMVIALVAGFQIRIPKDPVD